MADDLAAALEEIKERQRLASDTSLGFARMEERRDALIKVAYEDAPRLAAAVERVLNLAGKWNALWPCSTQVREAITREITGKGKPCQD